MPVNANHKYFSAMVELSIAEEQIKEAKKALKDGLGYHAAAAIRNATKSLVETSFLVTEKILRSH
jgi:hypothetical protein